LNNQIINLLREHRESLAALALKRIPETTVWSEADLWRLVDLCDERLQLSLLDAIENEGSLFSQTDGRLDVRLESIERIADSLGYAIDESFEADEPTRLAAREVLRVARRTFITAIARGFQGAVEGMALGERERTRRTNSRLRAVQRLNGTVNSQLDFDETLAQAAVIISEELHVDLCAVFIREQENELTLRATNRSPDDIVGHYTIHVGERVTGEAAQRGTPQIVRDSLSLDYTPLESQLFDRSYRGIFTVPIIFFGTEGMNLEGALTLLTETPRDYLPEEVNFVELVAGQLSLFIENSQIYRRTDELLRRQVISITTLQRISATVATSFDLTRVLEMIIQQAVQVTGSALGVIFQIEQVEGRLHLIAQHNLNEPNLKDIRMDMHDCCVGRAIERGDKFWGIDCMHRDSQCFVRQLKMPLPDVHSSIAISLNSKGTLQGGLLLLSTSRNIQPQMQARIVETFASEAAIAIESANLYEETRRALEIKSHLLQEMHHRVKNNLLSIAAILRMEKRRTVAPEATRVLSESISRIDGMAATHDLLSQEDRLGAAKVIDIAQKLLGVVTSSLVPPTLHVKFDVIEQGTVEVHSKKALALALALNELLANAIEHGMVNRTEGKLRIGAWEDDDDIHLIIADDGASLKEPMNMATLQSLGLSLVRDMTRDQLRGTFRLYPSALPTGMREHPEDESLWTIAELIFPAEREVLPGSSPSVG